MSFKKINIKEFLSQKGADNYWHWSWSLGLGLLTLVTLFVRYAQPIKDSDIWFHMLYGRYFLENLTLNPDHTLFTWTPVITDTIYCAWFSEIFFYLLYQLGNLPAFFTFRYLCLLVFVGAVLLYARKLKIASHPLVWLLCLTGLLMSISATYIKPEIFSFVLMTLTVWNWWHIRFTRDTALKNCYFFPLLMLVWVNSHGGFIFGATFLILIGIGELLNGYFYPHNALPAKIRKHLFISLLLSGLAVFITPYGYHYPLQLVFNILPTQENLEFINIIAAYNAPFSKDADVLHFANYANIAIIILILLLIQNLKQKNIEWSGILTNLVFAWLYTRFMRTTFYWAPVFVFYAINLLSIKPSWFYPTKKSFHFSLGIVFSIISIFLSFRAISDSICKPQSFLWMGFGISEFNPTEEAHFIRDNYQGVKLGNTYNQGAYLMWTLWPDNKVFIDARHFPFRDRMTEHYQFISGSNIYEYVYKNPCDIWCIGLIHKQTCNWFINSPDWSLAFYSKNSAVFVRKNLSIDKRFHHVGNDIDTIQNPYTAETVLRFALSIQDWQTAKRVIKRMEEHFQCSNQKQLAASASVLMNGVLAYFNRNYEEAVQLLESIPAASLKNDAILAYCLLYLAAEAWGKNDNHSSLELSRRAWEVFPNNPYTVYNLGVIGWYARHHTGGVTQKKDGEPIQGNNIDEDYKKTLWFRSIKTVVHNTANVSKDDPYVNVARAILAGSYQQRPPMMLPPEPVNINRNE